MTAATGRCAPAVPDMRPSGSHGGSASRDPRGAASRRVECVPVVFEVCTRHAPRRIESDPRITARAPHRADRGRRRASARATRDRVPAYYRHSRHEAQTAVPRFARHMYRFELWQMSYPTSDTASQAEARLIKSRSTSTLAD